MKFALALVLMIGPSAAFAEGPSTSDTVTTVLSCSPIREPILGARYKLEHDTQLSSSSGLRIVITPVVPNPVPSVQKLDLEYQDAHTAVYNSGDYKAVISKASGIAYLSLKLEPFMRCAHGSK